MHSCEATAEPECTARRRSIKYKIEATGRERSNFLGLGLVGPKPKKLRSLYKRRDRIVV